MSKMVALSCSSCGGSLTITEDVELFCCKYCGKDQMLKRSEDGYYLAPVLKNLEAIAGGVERHASELAIKRLEAETTALRRRIDDLKCQESEARDKHAGSRTLMVFLGILSGFLAIGAVVCFINGNGGGGAAAIIAGLVSIIGVRLSYTSMNDFEKREKALDADIRNDIEEMTKQQAELTEHRKLVKR